MYFFLLSPVTKNFKKMFGSKAPQYASYLLILIIQALGDWKLKIEFSWEKTNSTLCVSFPQIQKPFRVASERI